MLTAYLTFEQPAPSIIQSRCLIQFLQSTPIEYPKPMMVNQAAWIKNKQAQLEVDAADAYETGAGELLLNVNVIAFSPIEAKQQRYDLLLFK